MLDAKSPLSLLAQLVSIRSLSGEEQEAASFVEAWMNDSGLRAQRLGNNVWCEIGTGAPRLLLNSHLDTVKPSSGWTADPLAPRIEDGRLTGLGANDAKGCCVALMLAATGVDAAPQAGGTIILALTAEEEIGGPGGICSLLPCLGVIDAAIVGEPTGMRPCLAQRGMLLLNCEAHGSGGHVAHAGSTGFTNAIHLAARDIAVLEQLRLGSHPLLGECRAQATMIDGGISTNQVPDRCTFTVDIRSLPGQDHDELAAVVTDKLQSHVAVRSKRYLPVSTHEDHPIARACMAASASEPVGSATVSDWSLLGGIPAVKLGPGESIRSHCPDEYVTEAELEAAVHVYTCAVKAYMKETQRG